MDKNSGPDGTAHHGAQQGKAVDGSGVPEVDHCRLIPLRRPAEWLGYQPIDTPGTKMYHPSNGLPRTANTWGYVAVHEKQEANRVAAASHGELPRLPSREGRKKQKLKERKNQKGDQTLGYLGVVKPVTSREDVPLRESEEMRSVK
ncbi:hypothetical protein AVEN_246444-1 [Araneus ventricosus]|uniref:Uncharacterized protein n=1 Tax=Araneus ventricosus TaxID=182803 RepID=A0A4Y2TKF9_ARAVE|nr:hypothetical protein AVEN_246444-1 [Araneus ventricosus]